MCIMSKQQSCVESSILLLVNTAHVSISNNLLDAFTQSTLDTLHTNVFHYCMPRTTLQSELGLPLPPFAREHNGDCLDLPLLGLSLRSDFQTLNCDFLSF